jgi:uncharacterized membrane protein YphA (DoxX/SURF4 family)
MSTLLIVGRILFSLIFLSSGINHLTKVEAMTGYAKYKKLPAAKLGVVLSGIVLILASLMVIFGYYMDIAGEALAVFLVLTSFIFHTFWSETDATAKMNETIAFFKDLALAGAALIIVGYAHVAQQLFAATHQHALGWAVSYAKMAIWK